MKMSQTFITKIFGSNQHFSETYLVIIEKVKEKATRY